MPVLPATVYPSMAASVPVPEVTTPSSIWTSWALVAVGITRWVADAAVAVTAPEGLTAPRTRRGATNTPPLATAL